MVVKISVAAVLGIGLIIFANLRDGAGRSLATKPVIPEFDLPLRTDLGEHEVPHEKEAIQDLFGTIGKHMSMHYSDQNQHAFRAVHAKAQGCVRAQFIVSDEIDPKLKYGIFSRGRTFDAVVRFSNGDGPPENDSKLESRGMAIKLLNVEGEKVLNEPSENDHQDFLMADQRAFFLKDVVDYAQAMRARDGSVVTKGMFFLKFHKELAYRDSATPILDPLIANYYSKTPYQLGPAEAMKFAAMPCKPAEMQAPPRGVKNYMRAQMKKHLEREDVCFQFVVQRRMAGPERDALMPIEDASKVWEPSDSPDEKVAEVHIAKGQAFDTESEQAACEKLSFNPWHSLMAHRPLGNLNRVRKIVYEVSSGFRHTHNQKEQ